MFDTTGTFLFERDMPAPIGTLRLGERKLFTKQERSDWRRGMFDPIGLFKSEEIDV